MHGSESFWANLSDICRSSDADCDMKIMFKNALYNTFDDASAEFYTSLILVRTDQRKADSSFKIHFRLPDLVKIIINEKSVLRYQCIFNHLEKIQQSRRNLIFFWKARIFSYKKKITSHKSHDWYLLHCLIRSVNILYIHCKASYFFFSFNIDLFCSSFASNKG